MSIDDLDLDDPAFESLVVGRKVKVLLKDVDLVRWKQDLIEDRNRLATLVSATQQVSAERDAKLAELRAQVPPPDQPGQPQGDRLHRLRRHRPLPLRAARALGQDDPRYGLSAVDILPGLKAGDSYGDEARH
ncbi:hypothetical protein [Allochromatium tepidum]|uniref:Uncharacterized protein n=1 Tax=Allochromatium tepidum TaxID=553982 RepID=A0ABM7QJY0_9GAMM|nr:hypothetical protein [Allochromatium tepidum]BCU06054.1 hypothetical protein Atep_07310 [Allochromatium tepidum]